jgi:hypothetical protein
VRDRQDRVVFSSGAIDPSGLIRGNDNDADPARFEPHYTEIRREDEVQIYESIMRDANGAITTGLLQATATRRTTVCCRAGSTRPRPHRRSPSLAGAGGFGLRR